MNIKVGDKVFVTDENLNGEVFIVKERSIVFKCEDGFDYEYPKGKIYKIGEDREVEFQTETSFKSEEPEKLNSKMAFGYNITFSQKTSIFDLHIEELAPNAEFSSAHEALLYQLDFVREVIEQAKVKRVKRLIFVHGIGKGKLRVDLRRMLDESYPNIEFFDGSYADFGQGATEIVIHSF